MPADGWHRIDLAAGSDIGSLAAELEDSPLASMLSLNHDPRWLVTLADEPDKQPCAYLCRERGRIVGFLPLVSRPEQLKATIGPMTAFRRSVRMLEAFAAPLVDAGGGCDVIEGDEVRERRLLRSLFCHMRATLRSDEAVFLSSVANGSTLHAALANAAAGKDGLVSVQHGPFYPHRTATIRGDYEDYLKALGSRTRADLRSTRKKFLAQAGGAVRTRCFRAASEVPSFVHDAMQVSRSTWQYQRLQRGLRDANALTQQYLTTSALGWFRSYVVYVGDQPVAFQVGHVYRDVFNAQETGYDPRWAHVAPGIFQHSEIMMDLVRDGGIRTFDFDRGDFSHKQRLATDSKALGYFHLIPATPGGRALAMALRITGGVSESVGTWLDRLGVRKRAQRLSRSGLEGRS